MHPQHHQQRRYKDCFNQVVVETSNFLSSTVKKKKNLKFKDEREVFIIIRCSKPAYSPLPLLAGSGLPKEGIR